MDPIRRLEEEGYTLHDGILSAVHVDYIRSEVALTIAVDTSSPDQAQSDNQMQRCIVSFRDILFVTMDAQKAMDRRECEQGLLIDVGPLEGERLARVWSTPVPIGYYVYWIFVAELNGFIYICGCDGGIEWVT